ncbi:hypothetical protein [Eubacterium limosum]|uniref:hypothetical protein n=1 Tax=Eubacterium limosum TaxID=1736 RepID=UPI003720C661
MIQIDMEMPETCHKCPMLHNDYCGSYPVCESLHKSVNEEGISRRIEECPLEESEKLSNKELKKMLIELHNKIQSILTAMMILLLFLNMLVLIVFLVAFHGGLGYALLSLFIIGATIFGIKALVLCSFWFIARWKNLEFVRDDWFTKGHYNFWG